MLPCRFRDWPRGFTAHLLVRIHLQDYATLHRDVQLAQRAQSEQEKRDARLHVQHARSPQPTAFLSEGHLGQRAEWPDGIGMGQRENPAFAWFAAARQRELGAQMASEAAAGKRPHLAGFQLAGQQIHEAIDGGRMVAGRLAFH